MGTRWDGEDEVGKQNPPGAAGGRCHRPPLGLFD